MKTGTRTSEASSAGEGNIRLGGGRPWMQGPGLLRTCRSSGRKSSPFTIWSVINGPRSNANSGFAAIWFLVELLRDPDLMTRVQKEFSYAIQPPLAPCSVPTYEIDMLCSGPRCQSVYAEILRLRVGVLISRMAKEDLEFDGWAVKKGERVAVASTTEGLDEAIWNAGTEADPHPIKEFWSDRFLIYPNDKNSGPLKTQLTSRSSAASQKSATENTALEVIDGPKFSMQGLTNSWIPYSGGARHCPGRHFAKQEMIAMSAIMTAAFEIKLETKPGWQPESDPAYFGFGTMPPKGQIPCKIRRRKAV